MKKATTGTARMTDAAMTPPQSVTWLAPVNVRGVVVMMERKP